MPLPAFSPHQRIGGRSPADSQADLRATHDGLLVDSFETIIYAIAFLLLIAAAVLVAIGCRGHLYGSVQCSTPAPAHDDA